MKWPLRVPLLRDEEISVSLAFCFLGEKKRLLRRPTRAVLRLGRARRWLTMTDSSNLFKALIRRACFMQLNIFGRIQRHDVAMKIQCFTAP
jgi:hypothetical protein